MKLLFELKNNVLVINEKYQGPFLAILEDSKLYKPTGYYDTNYEPVTDVPDIKFVNDAQLFGYERALEAAKTEAQKESSKYWELYNKKTEVDKLLKEHQGKIDALQEAHAAAITQVRIALAPAEDLEVS